MRILLTSVGRRSYLVDWFAEVATVHAANSEPTYALTRAQYSAITPLIADPGYIHFLVDYCRQHRIDALMSLFDIDLPVLAAARSQFEEVGTRLILASPQSVSVCNDKWQTHLLAIERGLLVPETFAALHDALYAIAEGRLRYPVIVKPRWGMGSQGIYRADNQRELCVLYRKCQTEVFAGSLRFESQATPNAAVLVQQWLDGQEHGIDVVNDLSGNLVAVFAKRKVRMRSGETDVGLTVDPAPFRLLAETMSQALRHEGVLSLDCFVCDDGIYLTEANCRISGHYPIAHLAGARLPEQIARWLEGRGTDTGMLQCKTGVTVIKDLVPQRLFALTGGGA